MEPLKVRKSKMGAPHFVHSLRPLLKKHTEKNANKFTCMQQVFCKIKSGSGVLFKGSFWRSDVCKK